MVVMEGFAIANYGFVAHVNYLTLGRPISRADCGKRLDVYLTQKFRFLNRSQWQQRIASAALLVNTRRRKPAHRLKLNDCITFSYPVPPPRLDLPLIYQDEYFTAVQKPSGIPCQPNGRARLHNLKRLVQAQLGRSFSPVHRLDLETSGIVICTARRAVSTALLRMFQRQTIAKEYLAIVSPPPVWNEQTINAPIGKPVHSAIRIKKWVAADGKPAVTRCVVLERKNEAALLLVKPLTGRTNQIRVHLAYCGHPVVGDKLYHADERVFLDFFAHGLTPYVLAAVGYPRLCLHNSRLCFDHPCIGQPLDLRCALPRDLQNFWQRL